jgi:3-oxochol-4-en-24-oyl-CoA dehydrogenase
MTIADTPEQQALQATLQDWAKRSGVIACVRQQEPGLPPPDLTALWHDLTSLGLFAIADEGGTASDVAAVVEQLAESLVPGPVMPTLLAGLLLSLSPYSRGGASEWRVPGAPAAVALEHARDLTATIAPDGTALLTGTAGPILGASPAAAAALLLGAADGTWYLIDSDQPGVTVTPKDPLDFSRPLAEVTLAGASATLVAGLTTNRVRDYTATLFAAEAAGVAAWCSATATDYAKVRRQFGRIIAEFQSVKHLCATMRCRAERAAAVAWDAARAAAQAPAEHPLAAAAAAALALDDAVENAKDCIQVLGGIGFTWEHDAHLYLRRALALRQLLGLSQAWRERAGQLAAGGMLRHVRDEAEQEADPMAGLGIGAWAIPAIATHGTTAQQDRFIQATLDRQIVWCQLFSEPEAGSDLAGLRTRAVRSEADGGWRLTGQKVWTSVARSADWAICLARTDPDVPKHKGLSYFLIDMHAAGIDIRPLREITGRSLFNEVFLDDVFVADDCLVGVPGDGWRIAMTTLSAERNALSGSGLHDVGALAVALLSVRGAHPAIRKLVGVEDRQAAAEQALTDLGPAGAIATEQAEDFLLTRCLSIAGGTTQVLLNQVAERVLGLPREEAR